MAAATETYFGLLADARSASAIGRVFSLKGRDAAKGIALLLPNREAWSDLVVTVPASAAMLADRFWPGPLTIALEARPELDPRLVVDQTVAVRLPGASEAARIAAAFGAPLTATSANLAGAPPAAESAEVLRAFARACEAGEVVVAHGRAPGGAPSTLVRVDGGRLRVLRAGAVAESLLFGVVPGSGTPEM